MTLHLQHNKRASRGLKSINESRACQKNFLRKRPCLCTAAMNLRFLTTRFLRFVCSDFYKSSLKASAKTRGPHLGQNLWGSHRPDTLRPPPKLTLNSWSQCLLGTRPRMPEPNSHRITNVFTWITLPRQAAPFRLSCMIYSKFLSVCVCLFVCGCVSVCVYMRIRFVGPTWSTF